MALFAKLNPADAAITDCTKRLAATDAAIAKLAARLDDAQVATTKEIADRNAKAIASADDATLDACEIKVRGRMDRAKTLDDAKGEMIIQRARERVDLDEAILAKQKAETVVIYHKARKEMETKLATWVAATAELKGSLAFPQRVIFGTTQGIVDFLTVAEQQIPPAFALADAELGDRTAAVMRGDLSAKLPAEPVPPPVLVKPETRQMFTLSAITWKDHDSNQRVLGKWQDVELPVSAALFGLKAKLLVLPTDDRTKQLRGQGSGHPEPNWLNDLDTHAGPDIPESEGSTTSQPVAEPIKSSSPFRLVDRGPSYNVQIEGNS